MIIMFHVNRTALKFFSLALLVFLVTGIGWNIYHNRRLSTNQTPITPLTSATVANLKISYPLSFQITPPSKEQEAIDTKLVLIQDTPFASAGLRIDSNTKKGASLTGSNLIDFTRNTATDLYKQYPGYRKEKEEQLTLLNLPATHMVFAYLGNDQQTVMHMEVYAWVLKNNPYFLELQSRELEKEKVADNFQLIIQNLKEVDY